MTRQTTSACTSYHNLPNTNCQASSLITLDFRGNRHYSTIMKQSVTIQLEAELIKQIDAMAAAESRSRSNMLTILIEKVVRERLDEHAR